MDICPYSGKHRHATRNEAQAQLRRLRSCVDPNYRGEVYRCRACRGWHVGRNRTLPGRKRSKRYRED